jgi:hypothetical protein
LVVSVLYWVLVYPEHMVTIRKMPVEHQQITIIAAYFRHGGLFVFISFSVLFENSFHTTKNIVWLIIYITVYLLFNYGYYLVTNKAIYNDVNY